MANRLKIVDKHGRNHNTTQKPQINILVQEVASWMSNMRTRTDRFPEKGSLELCLHERLRCTRFGELARCLWPLK